MIEESFALELLQELLHINVLSSQEEHEKQYMPYISVGKCVYKKNKDGSRGKKVGCTKGSIKDYLAALHIHTHNKRKGKNRGKRC